MKKRLFAGALALLMIIGLLPVSSMLKKPVETQAAEQTLTHKLQVATANGALNAKNYVGEDGFFKVGDNCNIDVSNKFTFKDYSYGYDFKNKDREIKFSVNTSATVNIKWMSSKSNKYMILNKEGSAAAVWEGTGETQNKELHSKEIKITEGGDYTLTCNGQTYLYDLEVITQGNTITINDEKANGTTAPKTIVTSYSDGASVALLAKGTDLLYWKNSNGVIVATGDKEIPVYYSDTYTAVYAKTGAKVEYLTPYGGVLKTYYAEDEITVPDVPTRYGYTPDGWDTDIETVKTSLAAGKDVTVSPKYKDNADLQYTITIDATDVDGAKDTQQYTVNTVVKASVTDTDSFACWKVGDDVVSYNPTYYFFANRNVTVTAVKKDGSEVSKGAIITEVEYSADNNTVIFEYTVPDEYVMTFAGVIASTNAENLASVKDDNITIPAGVYKLGADSTKCSNYNTYRYTLRKAGNDTWYVKPVLTYTDSTGSHTIYGNTVTMK